jgi:hypothetical protein
MPCQRDTLRGRDGERQTNGEREGETRGHKSKSRSQLYHKRWPTNNWLPGEMAALILLSTVACLLAAVRTLLSYSGASPGSANQKDVEGQRCWDTWMEDFWSIWTKISGWSNISGWQQISGWVSTDNSSRFQHARACGNSTLLTSVPPRSMRIETATAGQAPAPSHLL